MPILQRLPKAKLPQFREMRKFSSRLYPYFDKEALSSVRNIESLVIDIGDENDVDSSLLLLLTNLRALDIRSFSGNFGLEELPYLTNLTSLTLHYTHARNEHLVRLTNLTRLHFYSAPLINNDLFSTLTKLTNLDIGHFGIGTEARISVNTGLERLNIYGDNRLRQMELSRFPNLTKLKVMDVLHFEGFENLSSLKSLSIILPEESTGIYDTIPLLTNLTELSLRCTHSPHIDANHILPALTKLKRLELCGPGISNGILKQTTSLTDLSLHHNKDISNQSIKHLSRLTRLDVQCCKRISISSISCLMNLEILITHNIGAIDNSILRLTKLRELSFSNEKKSIQLYELLVLPNLDFVYISTLEMMEEYEEQELEHTEIEKKFWENGVFISLPMKNCERLWGPYNYK